MSDNDDWRKRYDKLYGYVLVLRKVLVDNKIDVPEMVAVIFGKDDVVPVDAISHPQKNNKTKNAK